MKSLILPLTIFLVVFLVWGCLMLYTQNSSEVLVSSMENVYTFAESGNWKMASLSNENFLKSWDKYEKVYALFMETTSLQDVKLSAKRCQGYIDSKNRPLAMGESASILSHIELLRENDTMEMGNLF